MSFEDRVKRSLYRTPRRDPRPYASCGRRGGLHRRFAQSFQDGDAALATYRCHGYPLVLGSDPKAMMAEIFGRADGICKGLGGSMHLTDVKRGFLGTSGIVGAGIPHAAGAAWAAQIRRKGEVVLCVFR